jgi:homoserine O-succinyltransferase/O-acetyltransferase
MTATENAPVMPLVDHNDLPTFERLREEGQVILDPDRALQQDIRELHIGLLNMMPDAALEATERQFFRLVGESNPIAQFYVHPFTLKELPRGAKAQGPCRALLRHLRAGARRGAGCPHHHRRQRHPPGPLPGALLGAAQRGDRVGLDNVTSTLCSCLATHAVMQFRYGQRRQPLGFKRWGVFEHRVVERTHPLVYDVNTRFDVPHSRFNDISRQQFQAAG